MTAAELDNVNVRGFHLMSLTDDSQRKDGQSDQYRIYTVDVTDKDRAMIPRASAGFYRNLVSSNGFERNSSVIGRVPYEDEFLYGQFPENFIWSTSSAAYQIEGGWNEGGLFATFIFDFL